MSNGGNEVRDHELDATSNPEGSLDRRRLLGAAAGGFALAASGLFLPEWLEEAEARGGAYGGALGGRHGPNQRGRGQRKRRTHGDKKDKDKNKNRDKPRGVAFNPAVLLANDKSTPLQTRGWYRRNPNDNYNWSIPNGWDWATTPPFPDPAHIRSFFSEGEDVIVQIGTDRVFWVNQFWPFNPQVSIRSGGWEKEGWNPKGAWLVNPTRLAIGESLSIPGIIVVREEDSATHVQIAVSVGDGHS